MCIGFRGDRDQPVDRSMNWLRVQLVYKRTNYLVKHLEMWLRIYKQAV